ncbi:MAG: CRISPR system precrRNA processing endoribonuclease RAMP protein Cas6 [Oscillospiraceae bacterium]
MLTQYRLTLQPERPVSSRPEWAYHLYAALLAETPPSFGNALHRDAVTPVSQFLQVKGGGALLWTVNLLGGESEEVLSPILERQERFFLQKEELSLAITRRQRHSVPDVETLLAGVAACSGLHQLSFHTATAFKSQGQYQNLPTDRLIVQSLIKKWNGCFADCPIEDEDGQGVDALAAGLRCRQFHLSARSYFLKGNALPGFVGTLTLENRLSGFQRQLADALLLFSGYAGVGIKTTLGMGGVEHRFVTE